MFAVRSYIFFIALTPVSVVITQIFGNSAGVVAINPWMAMSGWLLVSSLLFLALNIVFAQITLTVTRVLLPLILYIAWMCLSLIWAQNIYMGVIHILYWFSALLGLLLLTQKSLAYSDYILFAKSMYFSGFAIACVGLLQFYADFQWLPQAFAPAAVFINKNMAAQYILLTIPFALTKYSVDKTKLASFITAISAFLMALFLLLTEARASMLALSIIVLVLFVRALYSFNALSRLKIKSAYLGLFAAILLLATLLVLVPYLNEIINSMVSSLANGERSAINIRLAKWINAWVLFKDNWLIGVGINNWYSVYPEYHQAVMKDLGVSIKSNSEYAHNDIVQIAVELGVIGLMLYFLLIASVLKTLWVIYKSKDSKKISLALPLVLALIGIYTASMFSFPGRLPHSIFLMVMCFALISRLPDLKIQAKKAKKAKKVKNIQLNSYVPNKWLGFFLLLLLGFSSYINYRLYQGEIWYRKTHQYYSVNRHYLAMRAGDTAVAYDPFRYETLKYRANAYQRAKNGGAERVIIELLKQYPNSLNSLHRIVGFYLSQKKYEEALPYALHSKKIAPRSDWAHQNIITLYNRMGLVKEKNKSLMEFKTINPKHRFFK